MRRKVLLDWRCDGCRMEVESSAHLFWNCDLVREVWAVAKLFPAGSRLHFSSFLDLVWSGAMEAKWDQDRMEKIILVAWAVWTDRNKSRCGSFKEDKSTASLWGFGVFE